MCISFVFHKFIKEVLIQLQCCGGFQGCKDWVNDPKDSTGCGCDKASKNCVLASDLGCGVDSTMEKPTNLIYEEVRYIGLNKQLINLFVVFERPPDFSYFNLQPCASAVYDMVVENMLIIAGIGIAIALTEV